MNKKGHVLVHILITTVIVVVICTGLAQMLLMRYTAAARQTTGVSKRSSAQGAMAMALNAWNASNATCSALNNGFTLTGGSSANACNCEYTNNGASPYPVRVLAAGGGAPPCQMKACANDAGSLFSNGSGCPQ